MESDGSLPHSQKPYTCPYYEPYQTSQHQTNTKLHGLSNGPRKNQGVPAPFLKIIESPECPCDGGNQTVDHLIYECNKLQRERETNSYTSYQDKWPVGKSDLVKKHIKHFIKFANSIDFEKL